MAHLGGVGGSSAISGKRRKHLDGNIAGCRVVQAVILYRKDCGVVAASIITVTCSPCISFPGYRLCLITEVPGPVVGFAHVRIGQPADAGSVEGHVMAHLGDVAANSAISGKRRKHLHGDIAACRVVQAVIPYRKDCRVVAASVITVTCFTCISIPGYRGCQIIEVPGPVVGFARIRIGQPVDSGSIKGHVMAHLGDVVTGDVAANSAISGKLRKHLNSLVTSCGIPTIGIRQRDDSSEVITSVIVVRGGNCFTFRDICSGLRVPITIGPIPGVRRNPSGAIKAEGHVMTYLGRVGSGIATDTKRVILMNPDCIEDYIACVYQFTTRLTRGGNRYKAGTRPGTVYCPGHRAGLIDGKIASAHSLRVVTCNQVDIARKSHTRLYQSSINGTRICHIGGDIKGSADWNATTIGRRSYVCGELSARLCQHRTYPYPHHQRHQRYDNRQFN